jgi:hypothetical protein
MPGYCPATEWQYAAAVVPTVAAAFLAVGRARSVPLVSRCVANGAWLAWGAPRMPVPQREQLLRRLLTACPANTVATVDLTNADVRRGADRVSVPTDVVATVLAAHGASLHSLVLDGPRQSYHLRLLLQARPAAANIRSVTVSCGIAPDLLVQVVRRCPRLETLCAPRVSAGKLLCRLARFYGVYQAVDQRTVRQQIEARPTEPFAMLDRSASQLPLPALRDVTFTAASMDDLVALLLYLPQTAESLSLMDCQFYHVTTPVLHILWPLVVSLSHFCLHGNLYHNAFDSFRTMLRWSSDNSITMPRLRSLAFTSKRNVYFTGHTFAPQDVAAIGRMAPNLIRLCISLLDPATELQCVCDTIPASFPSCVHLELPHAAWVGATRGFTLPDVLPELLLERMPWLRRIRVARGDIFTPQNPGGYLRSGCYFRGSSALHAWTGVVAARRARGLPKLRVLPEWNLE